MTYPTVTELRRPLEPTTHDPFADGLRAGIAAWGEPGAPPNRLTTGLVILPLRRQPRYAE